MRVLSKPLNKGEVFPCGISQAKKTFSETSVVLNFAHSSRIYGTYRNTFDMFYLKNNIKGRVISSMYMYPGEQEPFLSFYVLKKEQFTDKLQCEFEEKFLKEYFVFYKEMLCKKFPYVSHVMLVELKDNQLLLHRFKEK